MGIHTYSLDDEVARKFKEETPSQETSKVLEHLMKEYLDEAPDQNIQVDLQKISLSDAQRDFLEALVDRNIKQKTTNSLLHLAKKRGIYGRSHHFGEGLSTIVEHSEIPYVRSSNGKIVTDEVTCSCGASSYFHILVDNDMKCPGCEKVIVRA